MVFFWVCHGNREAECGSVNVKWDLPIFCILLQCIHGVRPSLSSSVIAPLLQVIWQHILMWRKFAGVILPFVVPSSFLRDLCTKRSHRQSDPLTLFVSTWQDLLLWQGATYFGVEEAITECKEWAASTLCKVIKEADEDFLPHLPSIWQSAIDNGEQPQTNPFSQNIDSSSVTLRVLKFVTTAQWVLSQDKIDVVEVNFFASMKEWVLSRSSASEDLPSTL